MAHPPLPGIIAAMRAADKPMNSIKSAIVGRPALTYVKSAA